MTESRIIGMYRGFSGKSRTTAVAECDSARLGVVIGLKMN